MEEGEVMAEKGEGLTSGVMEVDEKAEKVMHPKKNLF